MKRIILLFAMLLSFSNGIFAQESNNPESVKPLFDVEIVRKVSLMDIEGKVYEDVVVTMKSITPDYFISDKYKVKIFIQDANGKKIWKKTLKNVYLYVFSNGQVEIGQQKFTQILIYKSPTADKIYGMIREKEGIY